MKQLVLVLLVTLMAALVSQGDASTLRLQQDLLQQNRNDAQGLSAPTWTYRPTTTKPTAKPTPTLKPTACQRAGTYDNGCPASPCCAGSTCFGSYCVDNAALG